MSAVGDLDSSLSISLILSCASSHLTPFGGLELRASLALLSSSSSFFIRASSSFLSLILTPFPVVGGRPRFLFYLSWISGSSSSPTSTISILSWLSTSPSRELSAVLAQTAGGRLRSLGSGGRHDVQGSIIPPALNCYWGARCQRPFRRVECYLDTIVGPPPFDANARLLYFHETNLCLREGLPLRSIYHHLTGLGPGGSRRFDRSS